MKRSKSFFLPLFTLCLGLLFFSTCEDDDVSLQFDCTDGILNGDEARIDCGGAMCIPCEDIFGTWVPANAELGITLNAYSRGEIKITFRPGGVLFWEGFRHTENLGNYTFDESGVDGIHAVSITIPEGELDPSYGYPYTYTFHGIFEITDNSMLLEITPTHDLEYIDPPTVSAGFGSTNGGSVGEGNVDLMMREE